MNLEPGAASETRQAGGHSADIRAFGRGASFAIVGAGIGALLQFAAVLMLTHGLTAESAGAVLETIAFFTIVTAIADLGADAGLIREIGGLVSGRRTLGIRPLLKIAGAPVAVIGVLFAFVSFFAAHPLANAFFDSMQQGAGTTYLRIIAPVLPLAALTTLALAALRGFGTVVPFVAIQNLAIPALRVAFVAAALGIGLGATAVITAWTVPVAIGTVAAFLALERFIRRDEAKPVLGHAEPAKQHEFADFWRFAAPRGLASVLEISVLMLDVLLVGALRSSHEAAVYGAGSRLVTFGTLLLVAVSRPLAPQFSNLLARGDVPGVRTLYHLATWCGMALGWPLYILCAIFAPTVMTVFGPGYESGGTALMILSLAYLFELATGNMNVLLLMAGKSSWNLANSVLALALNIGLNIALIPRMGIEGAAIAWAATIVANNLAAVIQIRLLLGLRPFSAASGVILVATGLSFGVIGLLSHVLLGGSVRALVVAAVAGTALYLVALSRSRRVLGLRELGIVFRRD